MKRRVFPLFLTAFLFFVLTTACAQPAAPLPAESATQESIPTETSLPSPSTQEPTQAPSDTEPKQDTTSPALPPTPTPTPLTEPSLAGPSFAQALTGGAEGSAYPEQDISIISKTGRIQFLNIYANW